MQAAASLYLQVILKEARALGPESELCCSILLVWLLTTMFVFFWGGGGWEEEMNINEYKEKTIEILDVCILNFGGFPAVLLNLCRRFLLQPLRQVSKTCQPLATEVGIGLEHVAARWNLVELQEVLKQKSGD